MKQIVLILLSCMIISCSNSEKNNEGVASNNPFFGEFNEVIDFAAINGENIDEATELIQKKIDEMVAGILAVEDSERTFDNTMLALDNYKAELWADSSCGVHTDGNATDPPTNSRPSPANAW